MFNCRGAKSSREKLFARVRQLFSRSFAFAILRIFGKLGSQFYNIDDDIYSAQTKTRPPGVPPFPSRCTGHQLKKTQVN